MNPPADTWTTSPATRERLREAAEGRFALRVTAQLTAGTDALPHDISERLRFARERAVAMAQQKARQAAVAASPAAPASAVFRAGRGQVALGGPSQPSHWLLRLASVLPLVLLVLGLVLAQQHSIDQEILAAADIDSALLADDLPPDAYRDPGFLEYLRGQHGP